MKSNIILGAMLFAAFTFTVPSYAQLEVQTSGDVELTKNLMVKNDATINKKFRVKGNAAVGDSLPKNLICLNIEKTTTGNESPYYGLKSHIKTWNSMPTSSVFGIHSIANSAASSYMISGNQVVGVYGLAAKSYNTPSTFSAGVAGIAYYYGGIGVYGAVGSGNLPTSMSGGHYAGRFDGTVQVNGTLNATLLSIPSNLSQTENVQQIPLSILDDFHLLQPVSYNIKQDSAWRYDTEAKELQSTHYGFIAQDIEKIFPDLVYKRGDKLSVNYIELIPLLILKVQELAIKVERQEKQIKDLQSK